MPCENCYSQVSLFFLVCVTYNSFVFCLQFTVFKRKKSCQSCSRFYCSNCLSRATAKNLCARCVIFTSRNPKLIKDLKPKDLIFYLQSKHIPTDGIIEKEELVNLVIAHLNSTNYTEGSSASASNNEFDANFEQIKQTCKNLFSSLTDKIVTGKRIGELVTSDSTIYI